MKNTYTYIDALNEVLSMNLSEQCKDKLTALRDQQIKRNSADRKPTKAQLENQHLCEVILSVLTADAATVTEIMSRNSQLAALSNQKVSALLNALVRETKAVKIVDKRVSKFAIA